MATSPRANLTHADGVALKEYMEVRLDAQRCLTEVRISAVEKAIEQSTRVLEERLLGIDARSEINARAIDDLKTFRDRLDGKASQQSVIFATLLGAAGLIFGIVDVLMRLLM